MSYEFRMVFGWQILANLSGKTVQVWEDSSKMKAAAMLMSVI